MIKFESVTILNKQKEQETYSLNVRECFSRICNIIKLDLHQITICSRTLSVRMWNDLLLDLDKALLCLDKNAHSRTDITRYYKLSVNSSNTLAYLNEMVKCYEDAIQVLQER